MTGAGISCIIQFVKLIFRLLLLWMISALALYLAGRFIPGFNAPLSFVELLAPAALLAGMNLILKPMLKFALFPLVLLTFGLISIVLNGFIIYLLDYFSKKVTIDGWVPLILGTILISSVNGICQHLLLHKS